MTRRNGICGATLLFLSVAASGAVTLFDFEEGEFPEIQARTHTVGVTNAFATSGKHGLRFRCDRWQEGMPEWPAFTLASPVRDWSGYDRLVIDVVSLGDADGDLISAFLAGPEGRIQNGLAANFKLAPWRLAQWVIDLREWPRTTSPTDVARVHLFASRPQGVDVVFDRITLLKKGEELPIPESPCVVRDILSMMTAAQEALANSNAVLQARLVNMRDYRRLQAQAEASPFRSPALVLGTATSMEKIRPRGSFTAKAIPAEGLRVRLARNEYESLQVLVAPRHADLKNVRVRAGDLKGPRGTVFSSTNIACDVTGYVYIQRPAPYEIGCTAPADAAPAAQRSTMRPELGWWPDPILGFMDGVDIAGTDVQSFWVRVHCPARQAAGTYCGALTVSADGVAPVKVPFTIRVNGFTLGRASPLPLAITFEPEPTTQFEDKAGLAAAAARWADPLSPVNLWNRHAREWGDFLADYYITMDSLYHSRTPRFDALERLKSQGRLGRFNLGYWSYPASTNAADVAKWRDATVGRLRAAYDEAKRRRLLDHAYVYGCDEIKADFFPMVRIAVQELKKALPGVPVATTANDLLFGVNTALDGVDWFTPLTSDFDVEKAAASRAAGHQVWWYICCSPKTPYANMFIECPAIEGRLLMGAQTVRMRPDGFLYYEISIWNSTRCITSGPFTDWDPRSWTTYHGDGSWTCVGPDGRPLPTIRLENFRDGLEDYAYARLLEERLAARGGRDDAWSRKARELLAVPREVMATMKDYTGDPSAVYRWRDAMADLIETAGAKLK